MDINEQYTIYKYYIPNLEIGRSMLCPFPDSPEQNPSFSVFLNKAKDTLLWKLWNTGKAGNVNSFVARMEEQPVGLAYQIIMDLLLSGKASTSKKNKINISNVDTPDPVIHVRNYFTNAELKYWQQEAGLNESDLLDLGIYPLQSLSYRPPHVTFASTKTEPKFAYLFIEDGHITSWQMYNPLAINRRFKWRSGGSKSVIGNFQNLPDTAEYLFWCTSKKDGAVLWKHVLNKKYPFIHSPKEMQTESIVELMHDVAFRKRFANIIYVPDIEWEGTRVIEGKEKLAPGLERARKIEREAGIKYLNIPYTSKSKDICDLYKEGVLNEIMTKLLPFI